MKLVGGGSVINGATPSSFLMQVISVSCRGWTDSQRHLPVPQLPGEDRVQERLVQLLQPRQGQEGQSGLATHV